MKFAIILLAVVGAVAWLVMLFNLWMWKPKAPNKQLIFLDLFCFVAVSQISHMYVREINNADHLSDLIFLVMVFYMIVYCLPKWKIFET